MTEEADHFALREIRVADEVLYARPVAWSREDPYDPAAEITKYETACPSCSQLMHFEVKDIREVEGVSYVTCTVCGASADETTAKKDAVVEEKTVVIHDTPDVSSRDIKKIRPERAEQKVAGKPDNDDCPFQDPVEAGEVRLA